ncbi:MAG: hypothetical protein EAY81_03100 [Bacteroidetes bacterium]|nr:MAG: hypothetical protein EAY81_03100 [Bacteroidota bacterium]
MLKLPAFLEVPKYDFIENAPLARFVFTLVAALPNHYLWSLIITTTLVFLQAIFINYIVASHGVLYKNTFLPALFYVLINSMFFVQNELTPQLISTTFILFLFQRLCYLYQSQNPLLVVLDAGLYLGVAVLFNYDLLLYLPFILISVIIFTSFNVRYLIITLIGIMVPLYFMMVYFYSIDRFDDFIRYMVQSFESKYLKPIETNWIRLIPWAIFLPVTASSVFTLQQNFFRNKVKTRRIIQSIYLMLVFGVIGLFFENLNYMYAISYLAVPLSIVLAYYFISTKRFWLKEALFGVLVILALYYQL